MKKNIFFLSLLLVGQGVMYSSDRGTDDNRGSSILPFSEYTESGTDGDVEDNETPTQTYQTEITKISPVRDSSKKTFTVVLREDSSEKKDTFNKNITVTTLAQGNFTMDLEGNIFSSDSEDDDLNFENKQNYCDNLINSVIQVGVTTYQYFFKKLQKNNKQE